MKIIRIIVAVTLNITGTFLLYLAVYSFFYATVVLPHSDISVEQEGTVAFEEQKWELYGGIYGSALFGILGVILSPICFGHARKLLRKNKKSTEVKYNEPFVLYLRSFVADEKSKEMVDPLFSGGNTEEEALVNVFSEVASVFAIGNPADKYLPLGANRVYVEEHKWKNKVMEMSKHAKIIVLRLGETNNFWWEVKMCLQDMDKDKIIFAVPHSRNFSTVAILYKYLFENGMSMKDYNVDISKTSKGSISCFIYFGQNGNLICKDMKSYKLTSWIISYENMIRNALSDFFERYGLNYQKQMNVRKARLIQIAIIALILLYTFLYGYFGVYALQHP